MRIRMSRGARALSVVVSLLLVGACTRTMEELAEPAMAAAPGEIGFSQSGAYTSVDVSVAALATAAEAVFVDLGIALQERENEEDGVELKGLDGDWVVTVDIERDNNDPLTELVVSVNRGQDFEPNRSGRILRAILDRAR